MGIVIDLGGDPVWIVEVSVVSATSEESKRFNLLGASIAKHLGGVVTTVREQY